jgi:hypothetical protein
MLNNSNNLLVWVTLRISNIPVNTKFSAIHIFYINLKFYVPNINHNFCIVTEMSILHYAVFNFQLSPWIFISRSKLWSLSLSLLFNSMSILHTNWFFFFSFQPQFCCHQLTYPLISDLICQSQWPRRLRRRVFGRSPAEIVGSNPPAAWMFVCCDCRVLSGKGLCDGLITRPEESYRLWRVVCDQETTKNEEAKARYRAVGNTTTMVCNGRKTDRQTTNIWSYVEIITSYLLSLIT